MPSGWQSGGVFGVQEMVLVALNAFNPCPPRPYLPRPPSLRLSTRASVVRSFLNQLRPDPQNLLFLFSNIVLQFPAYPGLFLPLSLLVVPKLVAREGSPKEVLANRIWAGLNRGEGSCALPKYRGSHILQGRSQCSAGNHPSSSDLSLYPTPSGP